MGRLTDTAREAFDANKAKKEVPTWLPRLGLTIFLLFALYLVLSGLFGGGPEQATGGRTPSPRLVVPTIPPNRDEVVAQRSQVLADVEISLDKDVDGDGGIGTVTVPPEVSGGSATTAPPTTDGGTNGQDDDGSTETLVTSGGDPVDVPTAAYRAATSSALGAYGDGAVVVAATVQSQSDDEVVFVVGVDPDGGGGGGESYSTVTVVRDGRRWKVR